MVFFSFLCLFTAGGVAAGAYVYFTKDLPSPDRLETRQVFRSTKILDRNDQLLYEIFDPQAGKRTSVHLSEMSPFLIKATVAIEDSTFYENAGFSPRGMARAAWAIVNGEEIQGGSTITQQLIKMVLLTPEVSIERKIQEIVLAYQVNQLYTKDQVLEWYLNEIPYGNMAYGIEAAAEAYFGKSAKDLDLAEASMLAGIPQAPALLSPLIDPAAAKRRQAMVLDAMVRIDAISEAEAATAEKEPLNYQAMRYGIEAPHFVMYVRDLLEAKYGSRMLYSGGLTVRTTIDMDMQRVAERITRNQVDKLAKDNIHNAALVALRPNTGEIMAMLGSVDYFNPEIGGQVNIATSERQPGSTFKPITYSAAFLKGWSPSTVILDAQTTFLDRQKRPYAPKNNDNIFHGPVTVRTALSNSMNVPAVKAVEFVGVKNTINLAHQLGITSLDPDGPYDLSLTLGGGEVKLLDLAYAYSVFANGGYMYGEPRPVDTQKAGYRSLDPVAILRVEDANGKVLDEYKEPSQVEALSPQITYLITSILSDNTARTPLFGPNGPLKLSRPAAGKTGTTEDNRDMWTVGYTPDLVTAVWVGNNQNEKIAPVLSSLTAAPIWHDFMEEVLAGTPARDFAQPSNIVKGTVCSISGQKPGPYCTTTSDVFIKGTEPTKVCDIHRKVTVDKTTGKLATATTPAENREDRIVEVYPKDWDAWARSAGRPSMPSAPTEPETSSPQSNKPVENTDGNSTLVVSSPASGASIGNTLEVRGTASGKAFASYKVEYGEGDSPSAWKAMGSVHPAPITNGVLERMDTKALNGRYKVRVTLTERAAAAGAGQQPAVPTNKVIEFAIDVDHEAPQISITSPENNASISAAESRRVNITAQVSDNDKVAKTEFYIDNRLAASTTALTPSMEWTVTSGPHTLRAVARDVAGNEGRSQEVKVVVR